MFFYYFCVHGGGFSGERLMGKEEGLEEFFVSRKIRGKCRVKLL